MKKEIISGLKWTYFGVILKFISQLLIFSILAHILAPEDFGVISMSFIFINFALLLSQFGIGTALVQRKVLNKDHIKTGFTMAIFLGAFLFLAIYFSAPIISVFFSNSELVKILRTLALMFFFNGISMISRSLLQREMNFKDLMKIDIYSYFLGYGVIGIISALILKNVWALVFATICQSFMDSVLSYWFRMFPVSLKIKKTEAIELLTFGGWFSIGGFFNYFAINGDNFIIGKYLGSVSLGIYSRAYTLMTLPAVYFASIFEKVFFPALSRIQKETEKISNIYLISIEILFVLGATLSIFYYSFAEEIIMILLGGKWLPAIDMLKILSFGVLFRVSYKFCDLISKSVGQVFQMAWRQGLYALTVLISVYIGSQFSLSLVSGGIVISVIINYLLMSQLVVSILKIGLRKYLKIHMAGFFLGGYLFLVSTGFKILLIDFPDNLYLKLFMKATFFLVALSIFLFIYPRSFLSDELLKFFADLKIKNPILSKIVQKKFHN